MSCYTTDYVGVLRVKTKDVLCTVEPSPDGSTPTSRKDVDVSTTARGRRGQYGTRPAKKPSGLDGFFHITERGTLSPRK